jgi:bilirubin oxidase
MNSPLGPLDNIAFNFLQINVVAQTASPITTIPASLTTNQITSQNGAGTRTFLIQGSPNNSMTNFVINGVKYNENVINFTTKIDSSMIWQITNQSMMAHPWHIHGNHFYILTINGVAPPANMAGRKDVVIIPPQGGVVRLIMKYKDFADSTMPYMYHCHILSHEDKGMMGQFVVKNKSQTTVGLGNSTLIVETLKLYPNPASDEINIVLTDFSNLNSTSLNIYNVLGSLVYSVDKIVTGSTVINAAVFCKGVYTVELKSSSQFLTKKLIIE